MTTVRMVGKESRGQSVCGSEHPYCGAMPAKASRVFLRPLLIFLLVSEGVHANQRDCGTEFAPGVGNPEMVCGELPAHHRRSVG